MKVMCGCYVHGKVVFHSPFAWAPMLLCKIAAVVTVLCRHQKIVADSCNVSQQEGSWKRLCHVVFLWRVRSGSLAEHVGKENMASMSVNFVWSAADSTCF